MGSARGNIALPTRVGVCVNPSAMMMYNGTWASRDLIPEKKVNKQ